MKEFNKEQYGYSVTEVKKFVSDTIVQLELMINKVKERDQRYQELYNQYQVLLNKFNHYQSMEETLQKAIFSAEEASNSIKRNALEEANLIVREAKQNASRIVNDSLLRAEKVEMQAEVLSRNLKVFKKKLKLIVEQQLTIVEEIDDIELE